MGRRKILDSKSLKSIISVLVDAPDGLWVREIARRTDLKPMTVSYHISQNPHLFEEQNIEGPKKAIFRFVKLRKDALTKQNVLLTKIIKELE